MFKKIMSDSSPGLLSTVHLVPEAEKKGIDLCIIFQNKDLIVHRNIVIQAFELVQDGFLISLSDYDIHKIKYHVKPCYARYKQSSERHTQMQNSSKCEVNF